MGDMVDDVLQVIMYIMLLNISIAVMTSSFHKVTQVGATTSFAVAPVRFAIPRFRPER